MADEVVTLAEILPWFSTLPGYRKHGAFWVARCPCHQDDITSLALSNRGVLKCYAGCSFKSLMAEKRKAFPDEGPRRAVMPKVEHKYTAVDRYTYVSIDRKVTATKTRLESDQVKENGKRVKRFSWAVDSDGKSPSEHGLAVDDFGLWGADDLDAREEKGRVFVAEGEKATMAIRSRNELAVCPPGSASNVPPKEALECLRGWDVVIWRDLDGAGLRWAENLKRALRYIAKSVRIVAAPGDEGDDAVEFFAGGGLLEDLLAVTRVITERLGDDHFRVTMPTDYGPVCFDADEVSHGMAFGKSELNAVVRVTLTLPGTDEGSYVERINLYSSSSKATFCAQLALQFDGDKKAWTRIVNSAFEQIDSEAKGKSRSVPFGFNPERQAREYLVETLFPWRQHSMIFAPPAVGKSYVSQELSLCIALGFPFVDFEVKQGPVLILDYESQQLDWEERWERLLVAHGYDPEFVSELPIRYMAGGGIPLAEQWRAVKREMDAIDAIALIVDSAMPAAGGDMFSTTTATNYFSALDRIGRTSVTIGQVPAADASKLYGVQSWIYAPHGRLWVLGKEQKPGSAGDDLHISWTCTKSSNGRWPEPFAINVHFDGDHGPVVFASEELRDVPAFAAEMSDEDRIARWLQLTRSAIPMHQIVSETQIPAERVKDVLHRDRRFIEIKSVTTGVPNRWGLRAMGT